MNPYKTLNIEPDATDEEIRKAYRKLSKKCHPDLHGEEARPLFENLKKAHDILIDPDQRAEYDEFGTTSGSEKDRIQLVKGRAVSMIINIFNQFSRKVAINGYQGEDIVDIVIATLEASQLEGEKAIEKQTKQIKRMSEFVVRFKSDEGSAKIIKESQKEILRQMIKDRSKNRESYEAVEVALEIMEDFDFDSNFENLTKITYTATNFNKNTFSNILSRRTNYE
jgi:curved DNA-binding protein CbpA